MRLSTFALVSGFMTVVSAHFQLQFPPPRGVFNENNEPTFCDGYTTSVDNRTQFPLQGGFISINSEHPKWTLGVQLSPTQNPNNFANFTTAVPFFSTTGEGAFCTNVNLSTANIPGAVDGTNATLLFVFDGGDGKLYQCADVTLRNNVTLPSTITCTNATGSSSGGSSSSAPSGTSSGAPAATSKSSASVNSVVGATGFLGALAAVAALL